MVQPFNYVIPQADPFAGVLQGLKLGASVQQMEATREQQAMQAAAQQQATALKAAQEQEIQAKIAAQNRLAAAADSLMGKIRNGTATADDFAQYRLVAPKDQSEAAGRVWEGMSKTQQDNALSFGMQVMSALDSKDPQIGITMLEARAAAEREKNPQMAQAWETVAKLAKLDPANGVFIAGETIGGLPGGGGKAALEAWQKTRDERRARALEPATLEAKRRENIPSSILEAIDYAKLTPDQQKTFQALQVLKKPPAAVTNVQVTNLEKTASGELAKLIPDLYEQANSAVTQLKDIPRYRQALDKAITGPFADQRLTVARIGNALGFTGEKSINATQELIQGNAEMALRSRSMLAGQGQITEGEQKLLLKARSGDINFTKGELNTLFGVFERAAKAQYTKSTNLLKSAAGKSETAQMFLDNVSRLPQEEQEAVIPGAPVRPGQVAPAIPRVGAPTSIGGAMPGVPPATTDIRSQADLIIRGGR
jgi:hypothetical protein